MRFKSPFLLLPFVVFLNIFANNFEKLPNQPLAQHATAQAEAYQEYNNELIELLEMVYGEGFLSQGGAQSLDEMFEGINLNNKKILDLGSGLGMCDIYLANQFKADIIGIDPQETLVKQANKKLQLLKEDLKGNVSFKLMEDPHNLKQFADRTFDVIFSKESILHVPYEFKDQYFKEIYRVLKPGGTVIIMDWMHSGRGYSENTKKMMEMDGLLFHLLTPHQYQEAIRNAGFKIFDFIDITYESAQISQHNIDTILLIEDEIIERFGKETFLYSLESWYYQKEAFLSRELIAGILKATKK
ncbi:MAG: methyltransferase domain-containing protein [Parachlamydiaceae bacterium]